MAYLTYVIFVLLLIPAIQAANEAFFVPHKLTFSELNGDAESSRKLLSEALTEVGLVSITKIPNFKTLREDVLSAATECALHSKLNEGSSMKFILEDGTDRYTIGAASRNGVLGDIEGANMEDRACRRFNSVQKDFRRKVESVLKVFAEKLDALQGTPHGRKLMYDEESKESVSSFSQFLEKANQLEHFHTYKKFPRDLHQDEQKEFSLAMHRDHGLFIALVPAMQLSGSMEASNHGFYIELKDGQIVKPDFGDNNELVFMIGDGFSQWMNSKVNIPLRATPHAVLMPKGAEESGMSLRSWYGRMVLPSDSMFLESQGKTFREIKSDFANDERRSLAAQTSCSPGFSIPERFLKMQCGEDSIQCWASCQKKVCGDDQELVCGYEENESFLTCAGNVHDPSCNPTCVARSVQTSQFDLGNDICNGGNVSMYMDGFLGFGNADRSCLIFFFEGFVLNSVGNFIIAAVITVFIGLFTEFTVYLRRQASNRMSEGPWKDLSRLLLYSLQTTFGYLSMLIAMTYSIPLFFLIILGLTLGHRFFNFRLPVGEFSDPCCAQPDTNVQPQPTNEAKEL